MQIDFSGKGPISVLIASFLWVAAQALLCAAITALVYDATHEQVLGNMVTDAVDAIGQSVNEIVNSLTEEKEETVAIPSSPEHPTTFPINPRDFNPSGLIKVDRHGTKNGSLISWMDPVTDVEVFRWDENINYSNGPHYHIYGQGHYYPGDIVPEPYATIYFP